MEPTYEQRPEGSGKKTLLIIGGIILVVMIIALVYGATQKTIKNSDTTGSNVPVTNQPAPSTQGSGTVMGAERVAVTPTITGLDVVNLETFPYKVQARVKGTVPEGCAAFDTPTVAQSGKTFTISVTASKPKDAVCTQAVTQQEAVVDVPVAGLSAGTYTVKTGKYSKTFKLSSDNSVQYTSDK